MKFAIAVAVLTASIANAMPLKSKLNMASAQAQEEEDAMRDMPGVREKRTAAKARFNQRIAEAAQPVRRANDNGDEWEGQYAGQWNEEMVVQNFGFDINAYSVKYTGCQVATGFNDLMAQNEDYQTVLGTEKYATFRLCRSDLCSDNDRYGCQYNYGEYLVPLDVYVEALYEFRSDQKNDFCQYCETCAALKGYQQWSEEMKESMFSLMQYTANAMETFKNEYMYQEQQKMLQQQEQEQQYQQWQQQANDQNNQAWQNYQQAQNQNGQNQNGQQGQNQQAQNQNGQNWNGQNWNGQNWNGQQDMDNGEFGYVWCVRGEDGLLYSSDYDPNMNAQDEAEAQGNNWWNNAQNWWNGNNGQDGADAEDAEANQNAQNGQNWNGQNGQNGQNWNGQNGQNWNGQNGQNWNGQNWNGQNADVEAEYMPEWQCNLQGEMEKYGGEGNFWAIKYTQNAMGYQPNNGGDDNNNQYANYGQAINQAVNEAQQQWWNFADQNQNVDMYQVFKQLEENNNDQYNSYNYQVPTFMGSPVEYGYFSEDGNFNQLMGFWDDNGDYQELPYIQEYIRTMGFCNGDGGDGNYGSCNGANGNDNDNNNNNNNNNGENNNNNNGEYESSGNAAFWEEYAERSNEMGAISYEEYASGDWVNYAQDGAFAQYAEQAQDIIVKWDQDLFGDAPFGWDELWENFVDLDGDGQADDGVDLEVLINQFCLTDLSEKCYSQFSQCAYELHYDDLQEAGYNLDFLEEYSAAEELQDSYYEYMTCQQTDYVAYDGEDYDEDYEANYNTAFNNQATYAQMYEKKLEYQTDLNNCQDQACRQAIEQAIYADANYQLWITKSAWDLFQQYKNLNKATYVGATCADNGFDIELGVYRDEYCLFPHDSLSAELALGHNEFTGLTLSAVTDTCIPCQSLEAEYDLQDFFMMMNAENRQNNNGQWQNGQWQNGQWQNGQWQNGQYQNAQGAEGQDANAQAAYAQANNGAFDTVVGYCSMLYQLSAKCHKNLNPSQEYAAQGYYVDGVYQEPEYQLMFQSEVQQEQENMVCGLIESLNSGTYKEDGSIRVGGLGWIFGGGDRFKAEVSSASSRMNGFTRTLVFLLIIGSAAMGLWAIVLHGAIQRKMAPWQPNQPKDPVDLARAESGIVMGRSRSGPGTSPLI